MLVDGIQNVRNAFHERRQCERCYQGYQSYKDRILNHFLAACMTKKASKPLLPQQLHPLSPSEPVTHGFCSGCHRCNSILVLLLRLNNGRKVGKQDRTWSQRP